MLYHAGMVRKRIGEILIELGCLSEEQLADAVREQREQGEAAPLLGAILRRKGYVSSCNLNQALLQEVRQVIDDPHADRFTRQLARLAHDHVARCRDGLSRESFVAIVSRMEYLKQRIDALLESQERLRKMAQLPPILEQLRLNEQEIDSHRQRLTDLYNDICTYPVPGGESAPAFLPPPCA